MGDETRKDTASLDLVNFTREAFHEHDGILTIKNAKLSRLIHTKLVEAAEAAKRQPTKAIEIKIDVGEGPHHGHDADDPEKV